MVVAVLRNLTVPVLGSWCVTSHAGFTPSDTAACHQVWSSGGVISCMSVNLILERRGDAGYTGAYVPGVCVFSLLAAMPLCSDNTHINMCCRRASRAGRVLLYFSASRFLDFNCLLCAFKASYRRRFS